MINNEIVSNNESTSPLKKWQQKFKNMATNITIKPYKLKKWQTKFKSLERGDKRPLKEIVKADAKLVAAFVKKGAKKTGSATKKGAIKMKKLTIKGIKGLKTKLADRKANKPPKSSDTIIRLLSEIRDGVNLLVAAQLENKE